MFCRILQYNIKSENSRSALCVPNITAKTSGVCVWVSQNTQKPAHEIARGVGHTILYKSKSRAADTAALAFYASVSYYIHTR